ncbi:hypothetical protein BOTBODRAFT_170890 [Botryobasidium botryosum FD-172 SS1]|uniref:DUF6532 domain-containing protein n=1 Tax=Botryobasidium botryosum (strain FD-172 SS1) TaxID=930990 RepID=A0A067N574_BOTB1|nr:hypothetical protein BOTBODRAFT_170890 [Botryobasidium botryosum FD-172 SS1]
MPPQPTLALTHTPPQPTLAAPRMPPPAALAPPLTLPLVQSSGLLVALALVLAPGLPVALALVLAPSLVPLPIPVGLVIAGLAAAHARVLVLAIASLAIALGLVIAGLAIVPGLGLAPHTPSVGNERDYEDFEVQVIKSAKAFFRVAISTKAAFPDTTQEGEMAAQAWAFACKKYDARFSLPDPIRKMIVAEKSQIRNKVSTHAILALTSCYQLSKSEPIEDSRRHALHLQEQSRFHFQSPAECVGAYGNAAIGIILRETWFGGNGNGLAFKISFNPVPAQTIALIVTAIHFALDLWIDGPQKPDPKGKKRRSRAFDKTQYSNRYKTYLDLLKKFQADYAQVFAGIQLAHWQSVDAYTVFPQASTQSDEAAEMAKAVLADLERQAA